MTTLIAWGNIHQSYDFNEIPVELIPSKLRTEECVNLNARVIQRLRCRRLAHFLLWRLMKTANISTALLGQIYRTSSGRPQFPVEHIDFNISHSGDWVAVVLNISDNKKSAVGIDIESPKKLRNFTALLAHFAEQNEIQWFEKQDDSSRAFYQIWCLREAVLKSQGAGIAHLSEVQHFPDLLRLTSVHCPPGHLFFTDELPFYFAIFAAGNTLLQAQFFHWQDNTLTPIQLKSAVQYQVNV